VLLEVDGRVCHAPADAGGAEAALLAAQGDELGMAADLETDEQLDVAWRREAPVREGEALHLVVGWWLDEPERTGQVGSLARASWLGRGEAQAGEGEPLALFFQRPGTLEGAPPIGSTKISRRQLRFRPAPGVAASWVVTRYHAVSDRHGNLASTGGGAGKRPEGRGACRWHLV
jgi:hypothetical protein